MYGLTIELERCPDGVELVQMEKPSTIKSMSHHPDRPGFEMEMTKPEPETIFRYRTDRRETQLVTIGDLENPIVMAFVNATDDKRRQSFFERYGLLKLTPWWHQRNPKAWVYGNLHPELHHDDVVHDQSRFRDLLRYAGGEDRAAGMAAVNSAIANRAFNLQPTFHLAGPNGAPRLLLKSESLIGAMLMEVAMGVSNGARLAECEKCAALFLTGALTGRRSHARFCSDKCRVAAMRARNAAADRGGQI
jgi:hypothetical protein